MVFGSYSGEELKLLRRGSVTCFLQLTVDTDVVLGAEREDHIRDTGEYAERALLRPVLNLMLPFVGHVVEELLLAAEVELLFQPLCTLAL